MCIIPAFAIQSLYMTGKAFYSRLAERFCHGAYHGVIFDDPLSAIGILAANLVIKKVRKSMIGDLTARF